MTEQPTPPPLAVDAGAIERAVAALEQVSASLRESSARLVHTTPDPGTPPADDHVLTLQAASADALVALSRRLDESGRLLALAARRYRGTEDDVGRELRRTSGEGG